MARPLSFLSDALLSETLSAAIRFARKEKRGYIVPDGWYGPLRQALSANQLDATTRDGS